MRDLLVVLLACWPVWVGVIVTLVAWRIEDRQDATWDDTPTRPGSFG